MNMYIGAAACGALAELSCGRRPQRGVLNPEVFEQPGFQRKWDRWHAKPRQEIREIVADGCARAGQAARMPGARPGALRAGKHHDAVGAEFRGLLQRPSATVKFGAGRGAHVGELCAADWRAIEVRNGT